MLRLMIKYLSVFLYAIPAMAYIATWAVVRFILGQKVRFDTSSFDALFENWDK